MLKPYDKYNNTWNYAYLPFVFARGVRICPRPSALGKYVHFGQIRGQIRKIPGIIVCLFIISANSASYYYILNIMFWLALYDARSRQSYQLLVITDLVINTSAFTFAEGRASDTTMVAFAPSRA